MTLASLVPCRQSNNMFPWVESRNCAIPGGPVVKNLPANAGDMGLIPGAGRSHSHWATREVPNNCRSPQLQKSTTAEVPNNCRSPHTEGHTPQQEKPPQWEGWAPHPERAVTCCGWRKPECGKADPAQSKPKKERTLGLAPAGSPRPAEMTGGLWVGLDLTGITNECLAFYQTWRSSLVHVSVLWILCSSWSEW